MYKRGAKHALGCLDMYKIVGVSTTKRLSTEDVEREGGEERVEVDRAVVGFYPD